MLSSKSVGLCWTLFIASFIANCQANYESNIPGEFKIITSNFGSNKYFDDCRDYSGRTIKHGFHFVPPEVELCKMCMCENGRPKKCRPILCQPPHNCKSYAMGKSCCEFVCLDELEREKNKLSALQIIFLLLAGCGCLIIIVIIACRFQQIKRELYRMIEERRRPKENQNLTRIETISSELTFSQEIKNAVDLRSRNLEKNGLSEQIAALEGKLETRETAQENGEAY